MSKHMEDSAALEIGRLHLDWLQGGEFELDGGTMFGPVPKVLWKRKYPEEDNYIKMTNSPILVSSPEGLVLIDTGLGNKLTDKQRSIYRVYEDWDLPGSLAELGFGREDIAHVVLTHCDFDHAGGVVMHGPDGSPELAFPKARHYVQRMEWEDALNPNIRSAESYWRHNLEALIGSGNLVLLGGPHEVVSGVTLVPTAGHTRGHQIVVMQSEGARAIHMADLLPTHAHFNPLWVMAYDNYPLDAIALKEQYIRPEAEGGAWFTFYHDIMMRACRFDRKGNVTEKVAWAGPS